MAAMREIETSDVHACTKHVTDERDFSAGWA